MNGKRLLLMVAAAALLLLQFADCMSAITPDQQNLKCCGSMPCTPANQSHACCKTMTFAHAPDTIPTTRASLHTPTVATFVHALALGIDQSGPAPHVAFAAPQHSPPELYELHASLLI